jgi:integrase-like protein
MPEWSEHALKERKRPIRELMIEEEDRIAEVDREDYLAVREFATITGLRLNEVLLTWAQVDFDNAVVRLVAKGDEPRIVPLSKRAYAILWAERRRHPEWVFTFVARRTRKCPKTGQMYIRGQRYPITYWGLSTHRRRTFVKAGVNARWHDLRHTAGMRTVRATVASRRRRDFWDIRISPRRADSTWMRWWMTYAMQWRRRSVTRPRSARRRRRVKQARVPQELPQTL